VASLGGFVTIETHTIATVEQAIIAATGMSCQEPSPSSVIGTGMFTVKFGCAAKSDARNSHSQLPAAAKTHAYAPALVRRRQ
jgi:hypothetical protein